MPIQERIFFQEESLFNPQALPIGFNGTTSTIHSWCGGDTEERYHSSLAKGHSPLYKPEDISYSLNSMGYRSVEPSHVKSLPNVAYIGCSHTMGVGLPLGSEWVSVFHRLYNNYVDPSAVQHNLSVSGCSNDFIARVAVSTPPLLPSLVCIMATYPMRKEYISTTTGQFGYIYETFPTNPQEKGILESGNHQMDSYNLLRNMELITTTLTLKGIPFIISHFGDYGYSNGEEEVCPHNMNRILARYPAYIPVPVHAVDYARDMYHRGPLTHELFAHRLFQGFLDNKNLSHTGYEISRVSPIEKLPYIPLGKYPKTPTPQVRENLFSRLKAKL